MNSIIILLVLVVSIHALTEQTCVVSNDACSVGCPCAIFAVNQIVTSKVNGTFVTNINIGVTNLCAGRVYYVEFSLNSGGSTPVTTLTPRNIPSIYQGTYQWATNTSKPPDSQIPGQPTKYLRFTASGKSYTNSGPPITNFGMTTGNINSFKNSETFVFAVTGYKPTFPWFFRMHYGADYDSFGPVDESLCVCPGCDSAYNLQTIDYNCVLGYPFSGGNATSRTNIAFNENEILYTYAITNNRLSLYYADEWPMSLGINSVKFPNGTIITSSNVDFNPLVPTCLNNPKLGFMSLDPASPFASLDSASIGTGCSPSTVYAGGNFTCPRPLMPVLFYTIVTNKPNDRTGDWQYGGTPYFPSKVCGLWFYSAKNITVDGIQANGQWLYSINRPYNYTALAYNQASSSSYAWNFGQGSDPIPGNAVRNPSTNKAEYGAQVAWDLDALNLPFASSVRFQFMVHDGDMKKGGGDVGQSCITANVACPAGFAGATCSTCDTNPNPGTLDWTWFCFPSTASPTGYIISKIPSVKLNELPYSQAIADGTGFVPELNKTDSQGYQVSCDCKRVIIDCPDNCCGNGQCNYQNGTCSCFATPQGLSNVTTCCSNPPTAAPQLPCPSFCCANGMCNTTTGVCTCTDTSNLNGTLTPAEQTCCLLPPTRAPTPPTPVPLTPTDAPTDFPTSAITDPPCFNGGSFCGGHGACVNSVCDCDPGFQGVDCTGVTASPNFVPQCFNGGVYCNGHGQCINNACNCTSSFTGPACDVPVVVKCSDLQSFSSDPLNCTTCLLYSGAYGINCVWCPNSLGNLTVNTTKAGFGTCKTDTTCTTTPLYNCPTIAIYLPPECPDNCSSLGLCVNSTFCAELDKNNSLNPAAYPYRCGINYNKSVLLGHNATCACIAGASGYNCGDYSGSLLFISALAGGIIAAIILATIAFAAIAGGAATAGISRTYEKDESSIKQNPLYRPSTKSSAGLSSPR